MEDQEKEEGGATVGAGVGAGVRVRVGVAAGEAAVIGMSRSRSNS